MKTSALVEISKSANVSLEWLATGRGTHNEGVASLDSILIAGRLLKKYMDQTKYDFAPDDFGVALQILCKVVEEEGEVDDDFIHNLLKMKGKGILKLW